MEQGKAIDQELRIILSNKADLLIKKNQGHNQVNQLDIILEVYLWITFKINQPNNVQIPWNESYWQTVTWFKILIKSILRRKMCYKAKVINKWLLTTTQNIKIVIRNNMQLHIPKWNLFYKFSKERQILLIQEIGNVDSNKQAVFNQIKNSILNLKEQLQENQVRKY
jgi:hypothetical protein